MRSSSRQPIDRKVGPAGTFAHGSGSVVLVVVEAGCVEDVVVLPETVLLVEVLAVVVVVVVAPGSVVVVVPTSVVVVAPGSVVVVDVVPVSVVVVV